MTSNDHMQTPADGKTRLTYKQWKELLDRNPHIYRKERIFKEIIVISLWIFLYAAFRFYVIRQDYTPYTCPTVGLSSSRKYYTPSNDQYFEVTKKKWLKSDERMCFENTLAADDWGLAPAPGN